MTDTTDIESNVETYVYEVSFLNNLYISIKCFIEKLFIIFQIIFCFLFLFIFPALIYYLFYNIFFFCKYVFFLIYNNYSMLFDYDFLKLNDNSSEILLYIILIIIFITTIFISVNFNVEQN